MSRKVKYSIWVNENGVWCHLVLTEDDRYFENGRKIPKFDFWKRVREADRSVNSEGWTA